MRVRTRMVALTASLVMLPLGLAAGPAFAATAPTVSTAPTISPLTSQGPANPYEQKWIVFPSDILLPAGVGLLAGEEKDIQTATGFGWYHISRDHGLTNSAVLKSVLNYGPDQTNSSPEIYDSPVYCGLTFYNTNNSSQEVTVFLALKYSSTYGYYQATTAYPLREGQSSVGIYSDTNITIKRKAISPSTDLKNQFPSWFNTGAFAPI